MLEELVIIKQDKQTHIYTYIYTHTNLDRRYPLCGYVEFRKKHTVKVTPGRKNKISRNIVRGLPADLMRHKMQSVADLLRAQKGPRDMHFDKEASSTFFFFLKLEVS